MTPEDVFNKSVPIEGASHLILGVTPNYSGCGSLAAASDEFTAHRYAAILRKHGYTRIVVRENCDAALLECQRLVEEINLLIKRR